MDKRKVVMDADGIDRSLTRIAYEILEKNKGVDDLILVGIRTRGVFLAQRLQRKIAAIENKNLPMGILDITLYRDDLGISSRKTRLGKTEIPCSIDDRKVILIDDVLFTGRTIRAAMDALIDFGRPKFIQLAVLIDRGHRELPIQADYVGKKILTAPREEVTVTFRELEGQDRVVVQEPVPE